MSVDQPLSPPSPLTCEYCDCAPATHLLVADLAKPVGDRATDLVCKACGEAGVRDAAQISASSSSVWLFALIPAGKPIPEAVRMAPEDRRSEQ